MERVSLQNPQEPARETLCASTNMNMQRWSTRCGRAPCIACPGCTRIAASIASCRATHRAPPLLCLVPAQFYDLGDLQHIIKEKNRKKPKEIVTAHLYRGRKLAINLAQGPRNTHPCSTLLPTPPPGIALLVPAIAE
ncbi:hypothetical protein J6590_041917 [Homalodisca vitripennis]|nr:hypothetical protein J6590_041917 [Homalodisca vitripennis]